MKPSRLSTLASSARRARLDLASECHASCLLLRVSVLLFCNHVSLVFHSQQSCVSRLPFAAIEPIDPMSKRHCAVSRFVKDFEKTTDVSLRVLGQIGFLREVGSRHALLGGWLLWRLYLQSLPYSPGSVSISIDLSLACASMLMSTEGCLHDDVMM